MRRTKKPTRMQVVRELAKGTSKPDIHWRKILHIPEIHFPSLSDIGKTGRKLRRKGEELWTRTITEPSREEEYRKFYGARTETIEDPSEASYGFGWGKNPDSPRADERRIFDKEQQRLRERGY